MLSSSGIVIQDFFRLQYKINNYLLLLIPVYFLMLQSNTIKQYFPHPIQSNSPTLRYKIIIV